MKDIHLSRIDGFFLMIIWAFVLLTHFISFTLSFAILSSVSILWLLVYDESSYEYKQSKKHE